MHEPHWIKHSHTSDVRNEKIDDNCEARLVGPSQAMKDALEAEGLHVAWPDYYWPDDTYIEAAATFSPSYDPEYDATIDIGWDAKDNKTSSDVDSAIASCLHYAYMEYEPWRYRLEDYLLELWNGEDKLSWGRILSYIEAKAKAEKLLYRFSCVAGAVGRGEPIPPRELSAETWETIHISLYVATKIRDCLKKTCATMDLGPDSKDIWDIIDVLGYKLDVYETFNNEKSDDLTKEK